MPEQFSKYSIGCYRRIDRRGTIIESEVNAKKVLRDQDESPYLGQAIQEGGDMVPELTTCEQCGKTVIVLSWAPVFDDALQLTEVDDSHTLSIDCKIDCPRCGTRIQSIVPSTNGERA